MSSHASIYPRWLSWTLWGIGGCALVVAGLLIFGGVRLIFRPAPFEYSASTYAPERPTYCPGQEVGYEVGLTVRRAPTLLVVARTLWDTSAKRTEVPDQEPKYFVWTDIEKGQLITTRIVYRLPEKLSPGLYEIHGAATSFNSDSAAYRVPVAVRDCKPLDAS